MSVERSFEDWEEVQRHGQDLAGWLTQGFTGLIQSHMNPPSFQWPNPPKSELFDLEFPFQSFAQKGFGFPIDNSAISDIGDIGNRIGQVGAEFGAGLNGLVHQFFRRLPIPFRAEETAVLSVKGDMSVKGQKADLGVTDMEGLVGFSESKDFGFVDNENNSEGVVDEEIPGFNLKSGGLHGRQQLGPVLFVRDTTLLLPVHLSKQHLLWYGYDRKNRMHSLCPAVWSKHRRWLLMSMLCLNPLACSFVDLQFPNGQFTYISGEGLTTSAFLPLCGGLLQAQGQYPGEMRYSFSCKNKWGTRITSMVLWPDKSFALGLSQALAWKRSGLMMKPSIQFSLCPTFGGSNPGLRAEVIHTVKEDLNLICGFSLVAHPSAFTSISMRQFNAVF